MKRASEKKKWKRKRKSEISVKREMQGEVAGNKGEKAKGTSIRILLYTYVSETDAKSLRRAETIAEEKKLLRRVFELDKGEHNPKVTELLLDFHFMNLQFAKHVLNLSDEKLSVLLAMMSYTLSAALGNNLSQRESLHIFESLLKVHSFPRPPESIGLFTQEDLATLREYFMSTFYRHFPLYETAFKQKVELTLRTLPIVRPPQLSRDPLPPSAAEAKVEDCPLLLQLLAPSAPPPAVPTVPPPEGAPSSPSEAKAA